MTIVLEKSSELADAIRTYATAPHCDKNALEASPVHDDAIGALIGKLDENTLDLICNADPNTLKDFARKLTGALDSSDAFRQVFVEKLQLGRALNVFKLADGGTELKRALRAARRAAAPNQIIEKSKTHHAALWFRAGGTVHRSSREGPAISLATNRSTINLYVEKGLLHRTNGPAVERHENGRLILAAHFRHGKRHRASGPALALATPGQGWRKEYYLNGQCHRPVTKGPAIIETDSAGKTIREVYAEYGWVRPDPSLGDRPAPRGHHCRVHVSQHIQAEAAP